MILAIVWEAGLVEGKAITIIFIVRAGLVRVVPLAQAMAQVRGKGDGY